MIITHSHSTVGLVWVENLVAYTGGIIRVESVWR